MIKLIILDIDGVLTDGKKTYDVNGSIISKQFNDKDFTAIKRFRSQGVKVCFLSGDKNINEQIADNRGIDFFYSRQNNKLSKAEFVDIFKQTYGVDADEMVYIGDDDFDLDIMEKLKYTYCPLDSSELVKVSVYRVINCNGGEGVVDKLYYELRNDHLIKMIDSKVMVQRMRQLDEREKF